MRRLEKFKANILEQEEMSKIKGSIGGVSTGFKSIHEYTCDEWNCQDIQYEVFVDGHSIGTTPASSYNLDCIFT